MDPQNSNYWKITLRMLKEAMEKNGWVSPGDLELLRHFHRSADGVREITHFYSNYHSSRFLKGRFLMRVRRPLKAKHFEIMNSRFNHLAGKSHFEPFCDLEWDDNKDRRLHRIIFDFNKSDYAGLRRLIDFLNGIK